MPEKQKFTTGLTSTEWKLLPLGLRSRWWRETDYGDKEPSDKLKALIEAEKARMRSKGATDARDDV